MNEATYDLSGVTEDDINYGLVYLVGTGFLTAFRDNRFLTADEVRNSSKEDLDRTAFCRPAST